MKKKKISLKTRKGSIYEKVEKHNVNKNKNKNKNKNIIAIK